MTPHQLIAAAVRIFAIWYVIFLVKEMPAKVIAVLQFNGTIDPVKIAILIILILISPVLWFSANFIARAITPISAKDSPLPWTESRVLTIGASLIGLSVMAYALPPIIYYGTIWFLTQRSEVTGWDAQQAASLTSAFVVLAIGMWLFLGAHGLWQVWSRIRGRSEQ